MWSNARLAAFKTFHQPFSKRYFLIALLLFTLTWVIGGFSHIWYQQQILQLGRSTAVLERETLSLQRRYATLSAKIAQIHSPKILQHISGKMDVPASQQLAKVSWKEVHDPSVRVAQQMLHKKAHSLVSRRTQN